MMASSASGPYLGDEVVLPFAAGQQVYILAGAGDDLACAAGDLDGGSERRIAGGVCARSLGGRISAGKPLILI